MKKNFAILLLCLLAAGVFAQTPSLTGARFESFRHPVLERTFARYAVFQINATDLLRAGAQGAAAVALKCELEGFPAVDVRLKPNEILAKDYRTIVSSQEGIRVDETRPSVYPYLHEGSELTGAAVTMMAKNFTACFKQGNQTWFVEPLSRFDPAQSNDLYVAYYEDDVRELPGNICSAIELEHEIDQIGSERTDGGGDCGPTQLQLAIASDFQLFLAHGSSVDNVIAHHVATMNAVQANWDDDFEREITIEIVTQFIPTTAATDPFPNISNGHELLSFFRTWANNGGFGDAVYDLGHLRTPSQLFNPSGQQILGATFFSQLCSSSRYGVFSELTLPLASLRTVTSHEMGHSFGALHSPSGIMAGVFAGATNTWHQQSLNEINALIHDWTCLQPDPTCPLPVNVPMPPAFAYLCTDFEVCVDLDDNPCIATYNVSTNDIYGLVITVTGTTICIESVLEGKRKSYVYVTPIDYCGNAANNPNEPFGPWVINVDDPSGGCVGFQQDDSENRLDPNGAVESEFEIFQTASAINIMDSNLIPQEKQIRIFDISGNLLWYQNNNHQMTQVNTESLPAGILVVRVVSGGEQLTKRILKI